MFEWDLVGAYIKLYLSVQGQLVRIGVVEEESKSINLISTYKAN